jgi:cytochrome c oxidase subunit 4
MNVKPAFRRALGVWLALLALLAVTVGSAYVPMGIWNGVANLVIAAIKAALVALFFMHLRSGQPVLRLVAAAGFFTLALLVGLSLADYATRARYDAPWQTPAGSGARSGSFS